MLDRISTEFEHDDELPRGYAIVGSDSISTLICLPKDTTEEEVDVLIAVMVKEMNIEEDVIRSRLFGGVQCPYHEDRVHLSLYTCLSTSDAISSVLGVLRPISPETRSVVAEKRRKQIEEDERLSFVEGVPFSIGGSDA